MTLRKKASLPTRLNRRSEAPFDPSKKPEHLVGLGFRCWIADYETHEIMCFPGSPYATLVYLHALKQHARGHHKH